MTRSPGDSTAWEVILKRYHPAADRFLQGAVGDPKAADALLRKLAPAPFQNRPGPAPGRCRDALRAALIRLIDAHRRSDDPRSIDGFAAEDHPETARFEAIWREEILARAWRRLAAFETRTGQPLHTALRRRTEIPGLSTPELACQLGRELGRPISPGGARQLLLQAQAEFSRMLLDEVVATLPVDTCFEAIERELIATGLLAFCREALCRARPVSGRG